MGKLAKLEFAEPIQAHVVRGILSPEGGITIAQSGAALAAELWVWKKITGTPTNVEGWQGGRSLL